MDEAKLQWLKDMIRKNDLHDFYSSAEWRALAERARELQHDECQRCKAEGYYSPCGIVHHVKRVKEHPELALSIDNLECLCRSCHEEEHREKMFMNEERW